MKLVAVEEHFLPHVVRDAWAIAAADDPTAAFDRGEIGARLEDLGAGRIALMDEAGVDVQVLSLTTPGLHNLAAADSAALARHTNDLIAGAVARRPDRFQGFAALPTPAPDAAPRELERAVRDLGLKGAMVCGRTRDKHLDHPDFQPLFACAAELGVPVFIHPQIPLRAVRDANYAGFDPETDLALAAYGLGWHYEAGLQFVRLVLAGTFDRHPGLQVILGHWGEVVLFYLERLAALQRVAKLDRPVADYVRDNLYVTASGMFSLDYFRRCVEIVGLDRVLFSTDYPYQYRPGRQARGYLDRLPLDDADRAKLAHGNWERLTHRD
ncbi:amidohydrolase family protein [Methylobacterium sp. HMF5984]|uniref:amidohydrolase family protein n=1 Tax=Methylobacterium sp. HMF5984 TaxID=3367370 RepID=UPI003852D280